ncbi:hypothetical protein AC1031_011826 [Aphanomyces cochlioides]|nr:hypothetical protein AC1031_011826 [Aphanomyces cochlioides]
MMGPCMYDKCSLGANEAMEVAGCSVCDNLVHHMCSNELYEADLSVRVSSQACAVQAAEKCSSVGAGASTKAAKKKFYFTPKADLALLREILNVRPFAAEHGRKGEKYDIVAENLNEYLESSLSSRTVKDRFVLLVEEFEKTDAASRRKSGIAEDFDVYHQLLTDITSQIKDAKAVKCAKKWEKKAKSDRLESLGERLREEVSSRPSKRMMLKTDSEESARASEEVNDRLETYGGQRKTLQLWEVSCFDLVNFTTDYLENQMRTQEEIHELKQKEMQFETEKSAKEEEDWLKDYELRQAQEGAGISQRMRNVNQQDVYSFYLD